MIRIDNSRIIFSIVLMVAWIAIIIVSGAGWNPFSVVWNFSNSGAFGDSFGPLSAFMAAIAAISAIAAFQEQKAEIKRLQAREQVEDQRRDNERIEETSLRKREEAAIREQREETTFFQLLATFQRVVGETDIVSGSKTTVGRDAFRSMVYSFNNSIIIKESASDAWKDVSEKFENDLNHYFRLMYHIVVFVDGSQLRDKHRYLKILRALLSEAELTLLALNCAYGEGKEKFKRLIERYSLLHSLSAPARSRWGIDLEFEDSAFGNENT